MKDIERVDYLVVHCSATPADMDIGVEEIRRWHMQRGWSDVGYHFVIRRDGTLELGRNVTRPGAHAYGYNRHSLGICLVGGSKAAGSTKAENNFTDAQFDELFRLLGDLQENYPDAEVLGHRDLPKVAKACPSFDVRDWLEEKQREEAALHAQDSLAPSLRGCRLFGPRQRGHEPDEGSDD